ncbi:hypothetical protein [Bacillus sp. JCM 19041]|uniref:hypothetical protein n=1 Tax=Bacillus sp. JCM 19041 TaxID=1460637 RepID=UPI0006D12FDA
MGELLSFPFLFLGFCVTIQFMHAGVLLIFGYPSSYSSYLEGFRTKNPTHFMDRFFNFIFWTMISVAYLSYVQCSQKRGFIKMKGYYGIGIVVSFIFLFGFVNPMLENLGLYDWFGF